MAKKLTAKQIKQAFAHSIKGYTLAHDAMSDLSICDKCAFCFAECEQGKRFAINGKSYTPHYICCTLDNSTGYQKTHYFKPTNKGLTG